jgi:hypothetical protein
MKFMCFLSFNKPPKSSTALAIVREGRRQKKRRKTQGAEQGIQTAARKNRRFKTRNTTVKKMTCYLALSRKSQDKTGKPPN